MRSSLPTLVLPLLVVVACDDDITLPVGVHEGDVGWADVDTLCEGWRELSIEGNLLLQGSDPGGHTDLQDLSCVTSVSEAVSIGDGNLTLTSLDGLEQLVFAREVYIQGAEALTSASALSGLASVGEDSGSGLLFFYNNPLLISLPEFTALADISMLVVYRNDLLESLAGLESIETIGEAGLNLHGNARLADVSALQGIRSISASARITANPCLAATEAEALITAIGVDNIDGDVALSGNEGPC